MYYYKDLDQEPTKAAENQLFIINETDRALGLKNLLLCKQIIGLIAQSKSSQDTTFVRMSPSLAIILISMGSLYTHSSLLKLFLSKAA